MKLSPATPEIRYKSPVLSTTVAAHAKAPEIVACWANFYGSGLVRILQSESSEAGWIVYSKLTSFTTL